MFRQVSAISSIWIWLVLAFFATPLPGAKAESPVVAGLEEMIGRKLVPHELQAMRYEIGNYRRLARKLRLNERPLVLACYSFDNDLFVTTSIAGCMDRHLRRYFLHSVGVGTTVGSAVNIFLIVYGGPRNRDIMGTYRGYQMGVGVLQYGANAGVYTSVDTLPPGAKPPKVYLFGYTAGASFDMSVARLTIGRY